MSNNEVEDKPGLIKYQIYLGEELQEALEKYIEENYEPGSRLKTAIIRKAVAEFLRKEGYLDQTSHGGEIVKGGNNEA